MSVLKKLAGETVIYGLSSIVGRVLGYLLVPLYTSIFATEEYGVVSHLYAWVGFLMVIFVYRMETAFFRFGTEKKEREEAYTTAFWSVSGSTLLFASAIFLLSASIAGWMGYSSEQAPFISLFGFILAFDTLSEIPLARLRLEARPKRFAFVRLTNIGLNIFFNLFFLLFCPWVLEQGPGNFFHYWVSSIYSPSFGVGYIFLSNLIASSSMFLLLLPEIQKVRRRFDWVLWRKMIGYSSPLIIAGMAGIINEVADRELLLTLLPGTMDERLSKVGVYSACYKLAVLMAMFTQAFRYAAEPFFFSSHNKVNTKKIYADIALYFTIAGCLVFLVVSLYIDFFKHFLRSEAYWEGLDIVPILLLANLFLGLYYNIAIWFKLTDRTHYGAIIALTGATLTIGLNIWLIPQIGYMGSAWATLFCYLSMTILAWWFGKKYFPVPYTLKKMTIYILLAVSCYFVYAFIFPKFKFNTQSTYVLSTILLIIYSFTAWKLEAATKNIASENGQNENRKP